LRDTLLGALDLDLVGLEVLAGLGITILIVREIDLDIVRFLETNDIFPTLANQRWMELTQDFQSLNRLIGL
jgi:hypothetical protein